MGFFSGVSKEERAAQQAAEAAARAAELERRAAELKQNEAAAAAAQARKDAADKVAAEQARQQAEAQAQADAEAARKVAEEQAKAQAALFAKIAPVDGKSWGNLSAEEQAAAVKARLSAVHTTAAGDTYVRSAKRVDTPAQRLQLDLQANGLDLKLSAPVKDILAGTWKKAEGRGQVVSGLPVFGELVRDPRAVAALKGLGVKDENLATMLAWDPWDNNPNVTGEVGMHENMRTILKAASENATEAGRRSVGLNDLIAGYLGQKASGKNGVGDFLTSFGITEAMVAERPKTPTLDSLGRDLTAEARKGNLDPMVGRKRELRQVMGILKSGGNPVLLGEAGVGKSQLAEGLAQAIADGVAPEELLDKRVVTLNLDALTGGTRNRGDLEERTNKLFDELRMDPDVILFIDELHRATGQASMDESDNLAERLKPPMARGEFSVLGATTLDEFNQSVGTDPALESRFTKVQLNEPSVSETRHIVQRQMERIGEKNGVTFAPDAADVAIDYSGRYLPDQHRPRAPINLLRTAAGNVAMRVEAGPPELEAAKSRLEALDSEKATLEKQLGDPIKEPFVAKKLARLATERENVTRTIADYTGQIADEEQIAAGVKQALEAHDGIVKQAEDLAGQNKFAEAMAMLDDPQLPVLEEVVRDGQARLDAYEKGPLGRLTGSMVAAHDLADVIRAQTGIRVGGSTAEEKQRLLDTEAELGKKVKGQPHVLKAVGTTVRRAEAHVGDPNRPKGSFIFLGPTGTGKTETAKALADFLFGDSEAMTRIDMSEFQTPESVNKLIGSPTGYEGSKEGGRLTEAVRKKPYSVVLLDEIEKADKKVFDTLLQALDDGRLTDGKGKTVNFKNVYFVLTSNATLDELKAKYRPEFLNRFDHIETFNPLNAETLNQIVDKFLESPTDQLADQFIHLDVSQAAKTELAKQGYDPVYGARPLRRKIEELVENPAADLVLQDQVKPGDTIRVDVKDGQLVVEPQEGPPNRG